MRAIVRCRKSIVVTSEWIERPIPGVVRITAKRVYVGRNWRTFDRFTGICVDKYKPQHGDYLIRVEDDDGVPILVIDRGLRD